MTLKCRICAGDLPSIVEHGSVCEACFEAIAKFPDSARPEFVSHVWNVELARAPPNRSAPPVATDSRQKAAIAERLAAARERLLADPTNVREVLHAAECAALLGQVQDASEFLRRAANIYLNDSYFLKVVAVCWLILTFQPRDAETHEVLAWMYARLGYEAHARREAMVAVALSWPTLRGRALEIFLDGLTDETAAELRAALVPP